ncbi:MAG TPA: glycosyltransferase [Candidatus Acidoferrales bacterium]|nr:glycosyltransferase [Candidatus Acidoferrales bacterium]
MPELSVVIPTYNRLETLRVVIPALLEGDIRPERFEIVVADSNSTDGTAEFLAELHAQHPNLRHLPGPYSGRAMARNAGIDAAQGEIIFFTDSDIIASPDLLVQHVAHHRARSGIAVVGMEVQVDTLAEYERKREHPELRRPLHPAWRKHLSWLYFLTGNASVRRADLLRVGKFDESFTGYGHEDLELGYRLEAAGLRILYEPRAVNYHWQHIPFSEQKEKMKLAGRSTVRFYRKHPDPMVKLRLGMTPLSLGVHRMLTGSGVLDHLEREAGEHEGPVRNLVYQYHYVSGIKEMLGGADA